jgi:hypothetical protein
MIVEDKLLQVTAPCCATCHHWYGINQSKYGAVGQCNQEDNAYYDDPSSSYVSPITFDLQVCTNWQPRQEAE